MAKIKRLTDQAGQSETWVFWCPGCNDVHPYRTIAAPSEAGAPCWGFNGDVERPTFTPSLLVNGSGRGRRCHLFLTAGRLEFCADSAHELAGKVVDCPEWDDERW
jgi:hypothetical protein